MTDSSASASECACCGSTFEEAALERITRRPDVALCTGCIDGLAHRRRGLVRAVPVLPTEDLAASAAFWEDAGFSVSVYSDEFASAHRDAVELHLVRTTAGARDRGVGYLHARGVDDLREAWASAGLPASEARDEPWEMREFHIVDPGGNRVRVGQNL